MWASDSGEVLLVAQRCGFLARLPDSSRLSESIALNTFPDLVLGRTASGTAVAVLTYKNRRA